MRSLLKFDSFRQLRMPDDLRSVPYSCSLDHLTDCLRWLDRLISLHLLKQAARRPANPLEQFKGLVISEEEIAHLLTGEPSAEDDTATIEAATQQVHSLAAEIRQRRAASLDEDIPLALVDLAEIFSLSAFEESCVILALAPELSRKYGKLYAFLHDDVTRKKPTVDLALTLLCPTLQAKIEQRIVFHPPRPLARYRLLELIDDTPDGRSPMISSALKLDDRIADHLLGSSRIDARLSAIATLIEPNVEWGDPAVDEVLQTRLREFIAWHAGAPDAPHAIFYLHGPKGCAAEYLALSVCRGLGLPLLLGDGAKMLGKTVTAEDQLWLLGREASLQPALLGIKNLDALLDAGEAVSEAIFETAGTFSRVTFLFGPHPWTRRTSSPDRGLFIDVPLHYPDAGARRRLWESRLGGNLDCGALASKFRLTPGQMEDGLAAAAAIARWRSPEEAQINEDDMRRACRAQSGAALGSLARKIEPAFQWDDIILPPETLDQLRELCGRVSTRDRVLSDWGFARKVSLGRGTTALFAGPSGTGKTMAAEIIARELGLELYKIDLSCVVSKYIGETEKNLGAIFSAAENSSAALFFDECDALFGKRLQANDPRDRWANLEVSYLLQRIEEYEGLAILATNLRKDLDEAFIRRLAFTIHFPFPDEADRRRIWRSVWPAETPLAPDIDFDRFAAEYKLSGGNIKNVALAAAYLAATNGGIVTIEHLLRATRREFQKMGKVQVEPPRQLEAKKPTQSPA